MAALKTLPQPPEVCYNKGKGRGWDEGDRKPKRRALHADSRGERCFVATERAAEGHLAGGGTEARPHAAGDGFAGSNAGGGRFSAQAKMQLLLGCRSAQSWFADTRSRTCWRRRSRQNPVFDRGRYSRSAVLPLRTVKLLGGSVYIFLCGRLQVQDFLLAQTAADNSRRANDQRTGRHDGVLGDQRACCD